MEVSANVVLLQQDDRDGIQQPTLPHRKREGVTGEHHRVDHHKGAASRDALANKSDQKAETSFLNISNLYSTMKSFLISSN